MCKIAEIFVAVLLIVAAYKDWKTKRISSWLLFGMSVVILGTRLFIIEESLLSTAGGIVIGIMFFVLSKCTKESVGYGDSWLILLLGIFLGGRRVLELVLLATLLAGLFSLVRGIRHGWNRKQTIPFVPFLAAAYIGVMFL